jgi:hypothetical protein
MDASVLFLVLEDTGHQLSALLVARREVPQESIHDSDMSSGGKDPGEAWDPLASL